MILVVHTVLRTLALHGITIKHAGLSYCKVANVNHLLYFAHTFLVDLSHLQGHQETKILFGFTKRKSDLPDYLSPVGSGNRFPNRKSLFCFRNHCLILLCRGIGNFCNDLSINR